MAAPFTHIQLAAMSLREQLLRLLASQGAIKCEDESFAAVPWWITRPWLRPPERDIQIILEPYPSRPFPPATCSGWEDVIDKIADDLNVSSASGYPALVLACLTSVNDATTV